MAIQPQGQRSTSTSDINSLCAKERRLDTTHILTKLTSSNFTRPRTRSDTDSNSLSVTEVAENVRLKRYDMNVCICMYVCMHACMCIYECVYMCESVYVSTKIYVCMCVCVNCVCAMYVCERMNECVCACMCM